MAMPNIHVGTRSKKNVLNYWYKRNLLSKGEVREIYEHIAMFHHVLKVGNSEGFRHLSMEMWMINQENF